MPFQKGHKINSDNHNVGRKTDREIVERYINIGLAKQIYNEELDKLCDKQKRTLDEMRTLVTPFLLKDQVTKVDHTTLGEKITDNNEITKLTNILNEIHRGTSERGDGEIASLVGEEISD